MNAANSIVAAHHARIVQMAVRMGCTHDVAEDCAQETWLYLHRAGKLIDGLPPSHITVAMRGRVLDYWRSLRTRKRKGHTLTFDELLTEPVDIALTPDAALERSELGRLLDKHQVIEPTEVMTASQRMARSRHFRRIRPLFTPFMPA